jgi:hypothetical protein
MAPSHFTRRLKRAAAALSGAACVLLAIAVTAQARVADAPRPVVRSSAPTIVRETILRPSGDSPDTITFVLIGIGMAAALVGAAYLGARIATRTSAAPLGVADGTSAAAHRRQPPRTGM